jgi:adenylate kinase
VRLLIIGPPGAGKGTQARRLADLLTIPHIATGDLLREQVAAGTDLGRQAKGFMDRGDYVPDEVMIGMIRERLDAADAAGGFLLDGFPRTDVQAKTLDALLEETGRDLDTVLLLEAPTEEIVRRLSGRRTCPECQRAYHMDDDPPRTDEVCDDDGAKLVQRSDDDPETVRHRLSVYEERTAGLVGFYAERGLVRKVDGTGTVDEVSERIDEGIGS